MHLRLRTTAVLLVGLVFGAGALFQAAPGVAQPSTTLTKTRPDAASGPQAAKTPKPADLLLGVIVTWLATNFDLPAIYDHPRVEFAPAQQIASLRYGIMGTDGGRNVMGVFVDRTKTIYLPQHWTGRSPAELSILVHELVHHLQSLDKRVYDCAEGREKLAYEAQEKWLGLFGRSLLQDFQIDAMTLKVSTACM